MTQGVSMGMWYMYHFQGKVHTGNVSSSAFNTQSSQVPIVGNMSLQWEEDPIVQKAKLMRESTEAETKIVYIANSEDYICK